MQPTSYAFSWYCIEWVWDHVMRVWDHVMWVWGHVMQVWGHVMWVLDHMMYVHEVSSSVPLVWGESCDGGNWSRSRLGKEGTMCMWSHVTCWPPPSADCCAWQDECQPLPNMQVSWLPPADLQWEKCPRAPRNHREHWDGLLSCLCGSQLVPLHSTCLPHQL